MKAITPGMKVETGDAGTPNDETGLVLGLATAEPLGRADHERDVRVVWESGDQDWVDTKLMRPPSLAVQ